MKEISFIEQSFSTFKKIYGIPATGMVNLESNVFKHAFHVFM